jgi:hypothetical protein
MSGTYGPELLEPLAIYDPASSCWKMSGGMFPSDSMPSLATLPPWGMTHGGELFELPMPEPPTGEPASSSLLPTPKTTDEKNSSPADAERNSPGLRAVDALLATPQSRDHKGVPSDGFNQSNLARDVSLLPTPAVNDMGAGKTPEQWDEWTAKMQAKHGNGNGHGASLHIEAARIGANTPPPSTDGPQSSDDPHQRPPN